MKYTKSIILTLVASLGLWAATPGILTLIDDHPFFEELVAKMDAYSETSAEEKLYLHLDRTMLEPGEEVWFKAYVRNASNLKASIKSDIVYIELLRPNGSVEKSNTLIATDGGVGGSFQIPAEAVGGLWKIKAYTNWGKNTNTILERELAVQRSVLPRLNMLMNFDKKSYGPGDKAEARISLNTLENKPLANHPFRFVASLDGATLKQSEGQTDAGGNALVAVELPKGLSTNDGLLNIMISYNGQTESISRSIPIVLNKIDLQFMPEGGDLLSGGVHKVAFKALDEFGKPADIKGFIQDSKGNQVCSFESYYAGMGAFNLNTKQGENYKAVITKPVGIKDSYELPQAFDMGYALGVTHGDNTLNINIRSTVREELFLVGMDGGKVQFAQVVKAQPGDNYVIIPTDQFPIGISSVTLFDSKRLPRAERLVFVNQNKRLKISIKTDKEKYQPREKVKVIVEVKDERGMPMPGNFSLSVVDDKLLSFADDRQANILSEVLLASDLSGSIFEPNYYFSQPKEREFQDDKRDKTLALDYLMMTQGWRRFNWETVMEKALPKNPNQGEKALFKGVVKDLNGKPLQGVAVSVKGKPGAVKTDASGKFEIRGVKLLQSEKLVFDNGKEFNQHEVEIYEYNSNMEVSPSTEGKLIGKALDKSNGEGLVGANVTLYINQNSYVASAVVDVDGNFRFEKLKPGTYDVYVNYVGYQQGHSKGVVIEPGKSRNLKIEMGENQMVLDAVVVQQGRARNKPGSKSKSAAKRDAPAPQGVVGVEGNAGRFNPPPPPPPAEFPIAEEEIFSKVENHPLKAEVKLQEKMPNMEKEKAKVVQVDDAKKVNNGDARGDTKDIGKDEDLEISDKLRKRDQADDMEDVPDADVKTFLWEVRADSIIAKKPQAPIAGQVRPVRYTGSKQFYSPKYDFRERVKARTDFRKTLYWNPDVILSRNGRAELEFYMSDDISQFRVVVEGFTVDGGVGRAEHTIFSQLPFQMTCKVPTLVLSGDKINIPLTLTNNTELPMNGTYSVTAPTGLTAIKGQAVDGLNGKVILLAGETKTLYLPYTVKDTTGITDYQVYFFNEDGRDDHFIERIRIKSRGFPVHQVVSSDKIKQSWGVKIHSPVEGSLTCKVVAHPNTLKEVLNGMESLMRYPGGCFEQTSSSNYPNVLALDYMRETKTTNPGVEEKCKNYLSSAYKILTGYECTGGGFHWWGGPKAHEMLTAYGLMEFVDMKRVYSVDNDVITRAKKWLFSRRDGKGSWQDVGGALHTWVANGSVRDAYITWAMCEAGFGSEVKEEINKIVADAQKDKDPYVIACATNCLIINKDSRVKDLIELLLSTQAEDGSWTGKTHGPTASTGHALKVETTSLACLALMKNNSHRTELTKAIGTIVSSRNNFGYGNTQATVLALKSILEYAKSSKRTSEAGTLAVLVDGKRVASKAFKADEPNDIVISGLEKYIKTGEQVVEVRFEGMKEGMPFELEWEYSTTLPPSQKECKTDITTKMGSTSCKVGETVRLSVELTNRTAETLPSTMALIGIPGGMSAQHWQLKELMTKKICDYYELFDGYVVLHYASMQPNEVRQINLDLKAEIAGNYEAPASCSFLYYTAEHKDWDKPNGVTIGAL